MEIDVKEIQHKLIDWFKGGINLYKDNFVLILLSTVIAISLSIISILVLTGPLSVGLFMIIFRLIDKSSPTPVIADIFNGLESFKNSFIFVISSASINWLCSLILESIPGIGALLSLIFSSGFSALIIFGLPIIADKKLDFLEAAELSFETVKPKFVLYLLFCFIGGLISISGSLLFIIGICLTIPIFICSIAVAYRDTFNNSEILKN